MRKPLQGVLNIIRFNWHFYAIAFGAILFLMFVANYLNQQYLYIICLLIFAPILISLVASFYIYDWSGLYDLKWIETNNSEKIIVNINAGFDETSALLQNKFKTAELVALDFYNPEKHTEISIKRARKAYPPFSNTQQVTTNNLPLADDLADKIFVILSAHEIRNNAERIAFFTELNRILKPTGQIYVTEHLRDVANFLAYNIGFFHFFSRNSWLKIFAQANLKIDQEKKLTPFISTFILNKNGDSF